MKKFLAVLAVIVVIGLLVAFGLYANESGMLDKVKEALAPAASESSPPPAEPAKAPAKKAEIGVRKPLESYADVLDALSYEQEKNKDAVAWLSIPDTAINAPVMQSHDNTYYLRKDEKRQPEVYGCYFADFACSFGPREMLSPNTVIYGHSDLKDDPEGLKFSQLFKFTDETFASVHPDVNFSTMESEMRWQIFAAFYTTDEWNYINANPSAAELTQIVTKAKQDSVFAYDVPVLPDDKIITLSTCSVKFGADSKHRFVLMAKLMPEEYKGQAFAAIAKKDAVPQ